jgi:hypothetical protein
MGAFRDHIFIEFSGIPLCSHYQNAVFEGKTM